MGVVCGFHEKLICDWMRLEREYDWWKISPLSLTLHIFTFFSGVCDEKNSFCGHQYIDIYVDFSPCGWLLCGFVLLASMTNFYNGDWLVWELNAKWFLKKI